MLDPIFVAQGEALEVDPRGCLVGLKPFQLRQILALLMGAHLTDVQVQCVRNEGGLLLRESSLPLILEKNGQKRSSKGVAPTQTESDQAAYGTRKAKCYGAQLQVEAWDANAIIQAPLYAALDGPRSREWRSAGEFGDASWLRTYTQEQADEQHRIADEERWAMRKMEEAASSKLAEAVVHHDVTAF